MKPVYFFLFLLANAPGAFAMVIESGNTIVIDHPVHEDLYLAGGDITINAPVYGDLIVAGGTVYVNDSVTRDILLVGGNVTLNGYVGGKIRCAGGRLRITKNITGDLVIAGGTISIEKDITIFGNLLATGGELTLNGTVMGDIKAKLGHFRFFGIAGRDLDCRGGNLEMDGTVTGNAILAASDFLEIGNKAAFKGEVRYWTADKTADFGKSVINGKAIPDESLAIQTKKWYFFGATTIIGVALYLGMGLVTILLLQYLFAPLFRKAGDSVFTQPLKSLGMGFLFLLGMPVLIALVILSVVGIPVGLILLAGYIFALLYCSSITAVVAANWLQNRGKGAPLNRNLVWKAFGMFILLRIIWSTPFLGWLIFLVLVCMAFGAILLNGKWKKQSLAA